MKTLKNEIYLPDGSAKEHIMTIQISYGEIGDRFIYDNIKYRIIDKEVEYDTESITTRYYLSQIV